MAEDREFQELVNHLRGIQAQAEALAQQLAMVEASIEEHERAIETLTGLQTTPPGSETLVPAGAGAYFYGTIAQTDKVVVHLGAGVSIERRPPEALTLLTRRRDELAQAQQRLAQGMNQLEAEAQRIQGELTSRAQGGKAEGE